MLLQVKSYGSRGFFRKVRTRTWSDVVKGLKKEEKSKTGNSDKRGNGSKTTDSVEQFDSYELNQLKAKWMKGQRKRRQHRDSVGADKFLTS